MKLLIIAGIAAFIAFSFWYAKKNRVTAAYKPDTEPIEILTEPDQPIGFGYKIVWIAAKTDKKIEFADILGLKNIQPSNWQSGIECAYKNSVFITPQIGEWTLAAGWGLPGGDNKQSVEKLEKMLNRLSCEFGEAQFFGTHRVAEYHNWMKSVNGKTERIYAYAGESGETLKVSGEPTEPEKELNLFNPPSEEAASESYSEREDLDYADEELVMKIANNWSIDPTRLAERTDIRKELGLIGKIKY
ncbi:MAG TPA: hypothetical protein VFR70_04870 [Flavobacterium sp.]|nr:hypothetical protein [Flavobacterium sp.]